MAELLSPFNKKGTNTEPKPAPYRAWVTDEHHVCSGDMVDLARPPHENQPALRETWSPRYALPGSSLLAVTRRATQLYWLDAVQNESKLGRRQGSLSVQV